MNWIDAAMTTLQGTTWNLRAIDVLITVLLTVLIGLSTWALKTVLTHAERFEGVDKTTGLRSSQDPDGTFNAKLAGKGKTFSFTFTKPGTYTYYCDIHQGMNATITVVADSASTEGNQK